MVRLFQNKPHNSGNIFRLQRPWDVQALSRRHRPLPVKIGLHQAGLNT